MIKSKKGFTLIELSIVIIIIGLIVAAVVAGQSLIQQSRVRGQISQLESFRTAYYAFKLQFNAVPGDFSRASSYWPGAINGDGNNKITHDCDNAHATSRENLNFFHHLSESGLIPNNFNGTWDLAVGYPEIKISPNNGMIACGYFRTQSSMNTSRALFENQHQINYETIEFDSRVMLALNVSRPEFNNSGYNDASGTATPSTYQKLDIKIDDGLARGGRFKSHSAWGHDGGGVGDCLDGINGNYNLSNDQLACMALFLIE